MNAVGADGPLRGIRVLDMTRLAPGPYGSMLLADMGADVVVIGGGRSGPPAPVLARGKRFISLDLKSSAGQDALHRLVARSDVLLEGFRPGVAARLGAGYDELRAINPRLVYCSITGYGQAGPLAHRAGHDINYLAVAGALGTFGPADRPPTPPLNLLADFAAGGLVAAFGVVCALHQRERTGQGEYIDTAMVDGVMSMMGTNFADWGGGSLPCRGEGVLTGSAPFYRCYECADGRFVAVGALETAFFGNLWQALGLADVPDHFVAGNWGEIEATLDKRFREKSMAQWTELFADIDACVTPVLAPDELAAFPHLGARHGPTVRSQVPVVPRFAGAAQAPRETEASDQTGQVLAEVGLSEQQARKAMPAAADAGVRGLRWPPM